MQKASLNQILEDIWHLDKLLKLEKQRNLGFTWLKL